MGSHYVDPNLPTLWVCLHCLSWHEDRQQLADVACIVSAQEFNRDDVVFSRADADRIVDLHFRAEHPEW